MISFCIPLLHFSLLGIFIRLRDSWDLPVLGQMPTFYLPGFKVSLPFACLITTQSSPAGRTRGAGFLGAEVGVLMVSTWFSMRSCPWI